jgi:hypothetical protein
MSRREIVLNRVRLGQVNASAGLYYFIDTALPVYSDNVRYVVRVFGDGTIAGISYHKNNTQYRKAMLPKGFIDLLRMVAFPHIL